MRRAAAVLGLALAACGCAAFSRGGPATFREPAARMAEALSRTADRPAFRSAVQAESLHDVRVIGNRVLLDYRSESGAADSFDAHATCGPLELRDVAANERVWSVDRAGACDDAILAIVPRLAVLGVREDGGKAQLVLSTLALDSGAPIAKLPLEKGAVVSPSGDGLVVVEGGAGARQVRLHDGDRLEAKWKVAIEDARAPTRVLTLGGTVLVLGGSVTAIDRASGQKLRSTSLGADAVTLDVRAAAGAAYALILRGGKEGNAVSKIGADGVVAWTVGVSGMVDSVSASAVLTTGGVDVTALKASDGTAAWTGKLPGEATGGGLLVQRGQETLWVVPHTQGITAFDAASGAVRFTVAPFGPDSGEPHVSDRLSVAGPGLVVLDTARGVAGIDLADEGRVRYAIAVRSLPHVHRRQRLFAAYGQLDVGRVLGRAQAAMVAGTEQSASLASLSNLVSSFGASGGGMAAANNQMLAGSAQMAVGTAGMSMAVSSYAAAMGAVHFAAMLDSMNGRRAQQAVVALRQAGIDEESALLLRPISWATGRGILIVRKSDGAFREVVTGPPDVYEDPFRPASVAAFVPLARRVLAFSEGLDTSVWEDSAERTPVKLVARSLLGYAFDEAALHPAREYEERSVVPAAPPPTAAPVTTASAAAPAPAPPATAAPPAPAASTCRTHLDCKGGLVCPRGQCVQPACVADRDCGAGQFCSLEGVCEPLTH